MVERSIRPASRAERQDLARRLADYLPPQDLGERLFWSLTVGLLVVLGGVVGIIILVLALLGFGSRGEQVFGVLLPVAFGLGLVAGYRVARRLRPDTAQLRLSRRVWRGRREWGNLLELVVEVEGQVLEVGAPGLVPWIFIDVGEGHCVVLLPDTLGLGVPPPDFPHRRFTMHCIGQVPSSYEARGEPVERQVHELDEPEARILDRFLRQAVLGLPFRARIPSLFEDLRQLTLIG